MRAFLGVVLQGRVSSREDGDYGEGPRVRPSPWRPSGPLHVPPELVRSGRIVAALDAGQCPAGRLIHCADLLAANWRAKEMPKSSQALTGSHSRLATAKYCKTVQAYARSSYGDRASSLC